MIYSTLLMVQELSPIKPAEILVVDDIPANLTLLTQMLSQQGYKVRVAPNGKFALKSAQTNPPHLILLDIRMPEMDGYQVCEQLKADERTQEIPVIFISALGEVMDKLTAFNVGGVDYITKPFEAVEVLARIENQLRLGTLQKQLLKQNIELQQEIAQRKQAEEIIFQSRALLSSVLNCSLDGIAAMQAVREPQTGKIADFRCLVINPVIAKFFGKQKEDLIGKLTLKKFLSKFKNSLFEKFVNVVETGKPLEEDLSYEQEGIQRWYHFIAVKLGDGFSIAVRDITQRKQMEIELTYANQELQKLARTDTLTQVGNRLQFQEYLTQQWQRCGQEKQPLSIILCDIDHFKDYNDYYGHLAGDNCLVKIAQAMSGIVQRPADVVIRYGGEEFAIILPNTPLEGATQVTERIYDQINCLKIPHSRSKVSQYITVSFGIATLIPTQGLSPYLLMNYADQALYQAKENGRNRFVVMNNESLNLN